MRIQVGWIAVEEAEIELIGHLRIVPHSPVVVAIEPFLRQRIRQLQSFRKLERRQAEIGEMKGLIVDVFVEIALAGQRLGLTVSGPSPATNP